MISTYYLGGLKGVIQSHSLSTSVKSNNREDSHLHWTETTNRLLRLRQAHHY